MVKVFKDDKNLLSWYTDRLLDKWYCKHEYYYELVIRFQSESLRFYLKDRVTLNKIIEDLEKCKDANKPRVDVKCYSEEGYFSQ